MEDPMETASESSEPLTVDSIRSRLRELSVSAIGSSFNGCSSGEFAGDFQKFLRDSALDIESKIQQVVEEYSDGALLGIADLDSYVEHLKQELSDVEAQSSKISEEIEQLSRNHLEESIRLESNLEEINCSLDFMGLQQLAKGVEDASIGCSTEKLENPNLMNADMEQELQ